MYLKQTVVMIIVTVVCEAGQKRTDPNTCVNCAIGTYQKDRGQTSCTNCGIGKTTMSDTSKSETDCVRKYLFIGPVSLVT